MEEPVGLFDPPFMENLSLALPDIARKDADVSLPDVVPLEHGQPLTMSGASSDIPSSV